MCDTVKFIFLSRTDYENLKKRNISLDDLRDFLFNSKDIKCLTNFTKYYFYKVNELLNRSLFDKNKLNNNFLFLLNDIEKKNIEENIQNNIISNENDFTYENNKKYYEFFRLPENTILVAFSEDLLKYLTEVKENYLEFLLNVLCYLYDCNLTDMSILKRYFLFKSKATNKEYLELSILSQ